TIIGGVVELAEAGQWTIAAIIFVASVFVPIFKIIALLFLSFSVRFRMKGLRRQRTWLYRFTEFIGRWSMIDIFMISILIALVQLQAIATIQAGPGAVAFAAVVIVTMFAAMAFDPRLIWDIQGDDND
ncbi:paraquat-inducible protein A, partial [Sneathiella sp.]|uniref:paraquat-inducible protein A n=1 Tax=Sneathiella sp. TaxID=1964365 RepID=UPI0035680158